MPKNLKQKGLNTGMMPENPKQEGSNSDAMLENPKQEGSNPGTMPENPKQKGSNQGTMLENPKQEGLKGVCPSVRSENADKQDMNNPTKNMERKRVCPCMTTHKRDQRHKEGAMPQSKASIPS